MIPYTKPITIILVVLVLASLVAHAQSCAIIDTVRVLVDNLAGSSIGGGNRVDQGDIVYSLDNALIILWKRYYGGGRVNVTSSRVIVESWFDKGNNGYAGVTVKYDKLLEGVEVNVSLKLVEANGSIILLLHNGWNTGKGGDYPVDPALVVVVKPVAEKIIVNGVVYSYRGLGEDYNITLRASNGKATLKINDVTISSKITGNYSYITIGALSAMPGEHVEFKLTKLRICAAESNIKAQPYTEFNPPSLVVNNTATITIILPGGVTKTSVVPITTKPIARPQTTTRASTSTVQAITNNTVSKTTSREPVTGQEQTSTPIELGEPTAETTIKPSTSMESTSIEGVATSTVHATILYITIIIALLVIVSVIVFVYKRR